MTSFTSRILDRVGGVSRRLLSRSRSRSFVALLFAFGCGRSFEALTPDGDPDGGVADASFEDAPFCTSDACGFESDAGDAAIDTCLPGGWMPPLAPRFFDASATVPAVVDHDGSTFYLAFLNGNPSPCDGACPVVMEATIGDDPRTAVLETSFVMPAYWSDAVTTARLDARKAGSSSNLLLTSVSDAQVAWQWRPLRREGWQNDGTFDFSDPIFAARRVADVAPLGDHAIPTRASRIAIVHLPDAADAEGYFDDLQVVAVDESGTAVTYDDLFLVDGVRAPRVVDGSAWIAAIQNWDFPPTVQLVQIGSETVGIAATSCGVESFDAVAATDGRVAVAQDCRDRSEIGGMVELELRGITGAEGARVTVSQRRSFVPSRVASLPQTLGSAEGFVVAVVEQGASSPTLVVVDRAEDGLEVRESMRMPVADGLRLPITAVDVVARDDRTLLVTWTGTPANPDDLWAWEGPEAAFTIVQRCLCVDSDCF
jgi:hypothetical protein